MSSFNLLKLEYSSCVEALTDALRMEDEKAFFAAVDHIVHMKRTADRLLGDAYQWSTLGAGRFQMGIVTAAAIMGSHVRVGLEDSLYLGKGQIAESNASQVTKIRGILEALSLEVATPAEAREMLGLKGLANVGY